MQRKNTLFQKKSPQKKQWWKLIIWAVVLLPLLYWILIAGSYDDDLEVKMVMPENTIIEVKKGELPAVLAERLESKKIIISAKSFLRYLKKNKMGKDIKFGDHPIQGEVSIADVAKVLTQKAMAQSIKITIPEGLTVQEMDALFATKEIFEAGKFLECIKNSCDFADYFFLPADKMKWEGYFFPATYILDSKNITPQALGEKMLQAMSGRIAKHQLSEYKKYTLHEVLIMASIIEKESSGKKFNDNEAAMISGILWNRIEQGIPLGADATIRYGLKKDSSALTKTELAKDNAFNTRKIKGFPPFAIAASGDISLSAAVNPAQTDYLFYLHDKAQKIHYANTNAEHEANKSKYCGASCE